MAYIDILAKAISVGTGYLTGGLLADLDSNFAQAKNNVDDNYNFQFTNASLTAGVLTVNLPFSTSYPKPSLRRPDGTYEDAYAIMTRVSDTQLTFDFGGAIQTGTWNGQIIK